MNIYTTDELRSCPHCTWLTNYKMIREKNPESPEYLCPNCHRPVGIKDDCIDWQIVRVE